MSARGFAAGVAVLALLLSMDPAHAAVEIQWWHAMAGELGRMVEQLAADFNASQAEYRIVPELQRPVHRDDDGGAVRDPHAQASGDRAGERGRDRHHDGGERRDLSGLQLMREQGAAFDPSAYLPAVSGYYTDASGNMLSFPFNASTPILYYNKDQFRIAGLDPETPPRTWPEVEAAAKKLLAAGVPCGFTTRWPSWINVENLSAVHDQPISTKQNGFGGLDTELVISNASR